MATYRMNLISTRSISLESIFNPHDIVVLVTLMWCGEKFYSLFLWGQFSIAHLWWFSSYVYSTKWGRERKSWSGSLKQKYSRLSEVSQLGYRPAWAYVAWRAGTKSANLAQPCLKLRLLVSSIVKRGSAFGTGGLGGGDGGRKETMVTNLLSALDLILSP